MRRVIVCLVMTMVIMALVAGVVLAQPVIPPGSSPSPDPVPQPSSSTGPPSGNNKAADKKLNPVANGVSSVSSFLSQQYPSLAGLGGLLMGDLLSEWKATVNKAFCDTVILGGKDCWVSKICGLSPENAGGDGTLVSSQYNNGTYTYSFIAHIEGQRSEPATNVVNGVSETSYLYKITYAIKNPDKSEPNGYQLRFFYGGGSYDWFPSFQPFQKGAYIIRKGGNPVLAYSTRFYHSVCLIFQKPVEINGDSRQQVCNRIVMYGGGPTSVPTPAGGTTTTVEGGAAAGTPGTPGSGF